MKIMMVTPYFYPKVGGLENYALNIAMGLKKDGHDVFVVTSNHESKKRVEEKIQGLRVIRLPVLIKLSNTPINPFWYFHLKRIVKVENPDVINPHTPVPFISDMAVRASGRIPVALTYHNDLVKPNGLGKFLAKLYYVLLINKTLRKSDTIIATSEYYASSSPYIRKYRSKTKIVSPGVDLKRFNTKVDKHWLRKKYPNKKIILFVGNMDKTHSHKGLDVLIKAVALAKMDIQNIQLIAIGRGNGIREYEELAVKSDVKDNVKFVGYISDKLLPKYYAGANVFVLPSTTEAEGFGMVLAEAQACGTPVIGTAVGGIPYVVLHKKTGLIVQPSNIGQLAHAIKQSVDNNAMVQHALQNVYQNLSWDTSYSNTLNTFKRLTMPKVCLVHNIISPYRLPVYEEVNKQVNLTVLFCRPITKDRVWKYDLSKFSFEYRVLKGFSIGPVIFSVNALPELLRTKFDVIMANSDPDIAPTAMIGFLLAKLNNKKIIVWSLVSDENIHFFPAIAYSSKFTHRLMRKIISWLVMIYRRICFLMANHFLAFTNQAQIFLEKHGVDNKKISRTYQIMPLELLPHSTSNIKRTGKRFLYIGYMNKRKGLEYLIDAFMKLRDQNAELIIAGTGPTESDLKKKAKNDERIKFIGYVEGIDKANLYCQADIFILPTLFDVWGLVINEAIHYGLAVICSDAAEAKDLVDVNVGLIVPVSNTVKLHDAMAYLLKNQSVLRRIQKHNSNNVYVTDVSLQSESYMDAIEKSLK